MSSVKVLKNPNVDELLNQSPSTLYKYLDWSNPFNKKVIEANELFFSSPRNFNDPFDCKIEKRYDLLSDYELEEYFKNLAKLQSDTYNLNWDLQKIKSEAQRLKHENNFQDLNKLKSDNDFFFNQYDNFYAVFCTSTRWDSIPMWAYYANNHKGICVGFDLKKIYYSEKVGMGGNITYDEYPIIKPSDSPHNVRIKQTYYKAKEWSHEEEYRLMTVNMPKHLPNLVKNEHGDFIGIKILSDDSWYKEILLGVSMSSDDIKEVAELAKDKIHKETKIYQMTKGRFEFKLEKIEITDSFNNCLNGK